MAEGGKKETKTGFLIRTGLGYSFEVGGFQIVPSVDVDFLRNKTSLVWGVNFTKGF
jgi:hypothetical protein